MALTFTHTETETINGMEVCTSCAVLVNAGVRTDDTYGGYWEISPEPPRFDVSHCDLCRNPMGADRVSASVTV